MEELLKNLPQHTCSWLKGRLTLYKYQGFWNDQEFYKKSILTESFKAQACDILVCSFPKTGTTWLKALVFAIATREKFDESSNPLLTTFPHTIIPFLDGDHEKFKANHSDIQIMGTHLPYSSLPKSVITSNCKIVYIYRNIKDVIVSYYNFFRKVFDVPVEEASFEEAFEEICQGISYYGPYSDHILEFWKASQERPESILFLKYEDIKKDGASNVMRLAEFIGYPFSIEEQNKGVVEYIIDLCSFKNLKNLQVNKSGTYYADGVFPVKHHNYFRKAEDGDWKNYFTDEMIEKIDKLIDEKLSNTGLVLK